jgi:hypothetical protein
MLAALPLYTLASWLFAFHAVQVRPRTITVLHTVCLILLCGEAVRAGHTRSIGCVYRAFCAVCAHIARLGDAKLGVHGPEGSKQTSSSSSSRVFSASVHQGCAVGAHIARPGNAKLGVHLPAEIGKQASSSSLLSSST